MKGIASSQKWDFDRINFSKLQVSKVRFGTGRRFDFRIRFGKSYFLFKFPDEVTSWTKFKKGGADFEDFIREVSSSAGLDSFKVEGPFELRVAGENQASLLLPVCSYDLFFLDKWLWRIKLFCKIPFSEAY